MLNWIAGFILLSWSSAWVRLAENESMRPGPRYGHTLSRAVINGREKVILFGGRGIDRFAVQRPKTFSVDEIDGRFEVTSYEDHPIDPPFTYFDEDKELLIQGENETFGMRSLVFDLFNDIWMYDVEEALENGNETAKWEIISPNVDDGGCFNVNGETICTHPTARYRHIAEVVNDNLLVVIGGYSHFCIDFCSDVWFFKLDGVNSEWFQKSQLHLSQVPIHRWKANSFLMENQHLMIFGGQTTKRSVRTTKRFYDESPEKDENAFLSDMWKLDLSDCISREDNEDVCTIEDLKSCNISWTQIEKQKSCEFVSLDENGYLLPGTKWRQRLKKICKPAWPSGRSSVAIGSSIFHNSTYLFGGYRTPLHYPRNEESVRADGRKLNDIFFATPTLDTFLRDLWKFDHATASWTKLTHVGNLVPSGRRGSSLLVTKDYLYVIGGFGIEGFVDEVWMFDLVRNLWIQKTKFLHLRPDTQESYEQLNQVAEFGSLFLPKRQMLFVHGGHGPTYKFNNAADVSAELKVHDTFWLYQVDKCQNDCSGKGTCNHGVCICNEGYSGVDCSHSNLPGTFCVFDYDMMEQHCAECCSSGSISKECHLDLVTFNANHFSDPGYYERYLGTVTRETYIAHKMNEMFDKHSNVMSTDGMCHCKEDWRGTDCSVFAPSCSDGCNDRGYCLLLVTEGYCVCNPGYSGDRCEIADCLNNCSYPRGNCDLSTGQCECRTLNDVYDRRKPWRPFAGEDCSIIIPYSSAESSNKVVNVVTASAGFMLIGVLIML